MTFIPERIHRIMQSQGKPDSYLLATMLYLLSVLYGAGVKLRKSLYRYTLLKSKQLSCKVISVGNITVGGTGKTPLTVYLASMLRRLEYRVVIISRGYKGRAEKQGGIVSDGKTIMMGPDEAGDEPCMMAKILKDVPIMVGKRRFDSGMKAVRHFAPDVILMDDAFQHLKVERDIDLVLLDAAEPFGNGHLTPRGILREPVSALSRCDAFILTRCDILSKPIIETRISELTRRFHGKPIFCAYHQPYISRMISETGQTLVPDSIPRKGFAFSGIARNAEFRNSLSNIGFELTGYMEFPDHYRYEANDFNAIIRQAALNGSESLITTQKDFVRFDGKIHLPMKLIIVDIRISFGLDDAEFESFIHQQLQHQPESITYKL